MTTGSTTSPDDAAADAARGRGASHVRFKPVTARGYELGTRGLTVEKAAELAVLYGVPLAELLQRDGNRGPDEGG